MRACWTLRLFLVCGCATLRAAEGPPRVTPPPAEPLPPIFAPKTKAPPKKTPPRRPSAPAGAAPTRRAISPEMAARLNALAREIAPSPTGRTEGTARAASSGEASDAVLLDPFYVEEEKVPEFKERDLLTPKGKLDLAYKRHPGLKLGPLSLGNAGVARAMIEEEFAKERRQEMRELGELMSITDPNAGRDVRKKLNEASVRVPDPSKPGGPFRERGSDEK